MRARLESRAASLYHYGAAVGPTERLPDVRRYAPAPCFAARSVTDLEMDPAVIAGFPAVAGWTS